MALNPKLEPRQSHTLVMTPQLQQAIKLLRLANLELLAYVEREVEQNPLLEHADPESPPRGEDENVDRDRSTEGTGEPEGDDEPEPVVLDAAQMSEAETLADTADAPLDLNYDEIFEADAAPTQTGPAGGFADLRDASRSNGFDRDAIGLEQALCRKTSLKEHLLGQLGVDVADPVDRIIGMHLIDIVDEAGYIVGGLEGIGETVGCSLGRVEATLSILQKFDPPGVLARDIGECLAAQLRERGRLGPAMRRFLDNLDLLARHDYRALAEICGVDAGDIAGMAAEIRSLNPKPGLRFGGEVVQPVVPDVFVRSNPGGGWQVELNNDTLPNVLVNTRYYREISGRAKSRRDKTYLSERLNSANWLVKSLDQRAGTILRVATELVRQQDAFLVHGIEHLRPLNLRDIASAIEMHESTVSRVTANKFIGTPRGIFPMKYFFTFALPSSSGGEAHSAETVRHRIRELIDNEIPGAVLSDDKIVEALNSSGIDIARRTVAKYREVMRIPSSVERRRRKRAGVRVGDRWLTGNAPRP